MTGIIVKIHSFPNVYRKVDYSSIFMYSESYLLIKNKVGVGIIYF